MPNRKENSYIRLLRLTHTNALAAHKRNIDESNWLFSYYVAEESSKKKIIVLLMLNGICGYCLGTFDFAFIEFMELLTETARNELPHPQYTFPIWCSCSG